MYFKLCPAKRQAGSYILIIVLHKHRNQHRNIVIIIICNSCMSMRDGNNTKHLFSST